MAELAKIGNHRNLLAYIRTGEVHTDLEVPLNPTQFTIPARFGGSIFLWFLFFLFWSMLWRETKEREKEQIKEKEENAVQRRNLFNYCGNLNLIDPPAPKLAIPEGATKLSKEELIDKIRGTIFGAALGDAVGLGIIFLFLPPPPPK